MDKAKLEAWVRHLFLWGPKIAVRVDDPKPSALRGFYDVAVTGTLGQASQSEIFMVSGDGQTIVRGTVYDTARNPFSDDLRKMDSSAGPAAGPASAPVELVIFSDFQCSFCRQAARTLRQELMPAFPKDLRVVFKDFPLDPIHPWAREASRAGHCIARQSGEEFWAFHDHVFDRQDQVTKENVSQKLQEHVAARGTLNAAAFAACMAAPESAAAVEKSVAEGRALGITSTPTLFVNGRRLVGALPADQLKAVVEYERTHARSAAAAGAAK